MWNTVVVYKMGRILRTWHFVAKEWWSEWSVWRKPRWHMMCLLNNKGQGMRAWGPILIGFFLTLYLVYSLMGHIHLGTIRKVCDHKQWAQLGLFEIFIYLNNNFFFLLKYLNNNLCTWWHSRKWILNITINLVDTSCDLRASINLRFHCYFLHYCP